MKRYAFATARAAPILTLAMTDFNTGQPRSIAGAKKLRGNKQRLQREVALN